MFKPAVREQLKLRLCLQGPPKTGKTMTALKIMNHLVPGGKIAVVDTENNSARKYTGMEDVPKFDVCELETYPPKALLDTIKYAEDNGYDGIIVDSMSHFWAGDAGILEIVEAASKARSNNSYTAWAKGTPLVNEMLHAILHCKLHIICTMRTKVDYVLEEKVSGNKTVHAPKKVGMAPIFRKETEYEFDIVGELDREKNLIFTDTRCSALEGRVFNKAGKDVADILKVWLDEGDAPKEPVFESPEPVAEEPVAEEPVAEEPVAEEPEEELPEEPSVAEELKTRLDSCDDKDELKSLVAEVIAAKKLDKISAGDNKALVKAHKEADKRCKKSS